MFRKSSREAELIFDGKELRHIDCFVACRDRFRIAVPCTEDFEELHIDHIHQGDTVVFPLEALVAYWLSSYETISFLCR